MTFYEAAIEILKKAGRPLHFKKITELAIKQNLLSHIGKTPEVTMQARLNQEAQKEHLATIACVRPGVFALVKDIELADVKETFSPPQAATPTKVDVSQPPRERVQSPPSLQGLEEGLAPGLSSVGPDLERLVGMEGQVATPMEAVGDRPVLEGPGSFKLGSSTRAAPWPLVGEPTESAICDLAADILRQVESPMTTQDLAQQISQVTGRSLTLSLVDLHLSEDNRRRAGRGMLPRFMRPGMSWCLTERLLDRNLSAQFQALQSACSLIHETTLAVLEQRLETLPGVTLESLVSTTLISLGHQCRVADRREGMVTFEVMTQEWLIPLTVAVRLWHGSVALTGEEVAAFRGQLNQYGASHGVIMAPRSRGMQPSAHEEAQRAHPLPMVLVGAKALAVLILKAGVAIQPYSVVVPILDATWFT